MVEMVEDPEKVLEQMRPYLQWNIGADLLFKELQHCLTPEIQKTIKEQIKHEGNKLAVETILNQLLCKDDWPLQLYHALLSPSINRPKLARKLKGSKTEEESTKELDHSSMSDGNSVQNGTQKKFERCTAKTKVKNLPMIFLSTLKQNLDIEDGWKLLAVQLGYSSDDVAYIHFKDGSPTEHLIHHWIQENPDADLETIFSSLHKMEYESLSKELREISEYKHECVGGASSLVQDESAISIPDFNPVPDLLPSINDSLKKGEHVSPTISPVLPHKTVITEMDMPKYSFSVSCSADVTKPQIADSGFMEAIDTKNQNLIEQSNELEIIAKNPLVLDDASNDNIVSESTSKSKYNHSETASTLLKYSDHNDPLFEQIQISKPASYTTLFHSEENDKIKNEPKIEKESKDTKTVSGSEVKTAKMFVENVLESALTQQFTIEDPAISFEPEITSSVCVENIDIKENEDDSVIGSHESANPEELQSDFGLHSCDTISFLTNAATVLKNDVAVTQREDPATLSDGDNIKQLSGEDAIIETTEIVSKDVTPPEIEDDITDSTMKPVISEDTNVSRSENNSELIMLKEDIQNTKEQITKDASNKVLATNTGSMPNISVLESPEISLSELPIEPDTKELKPEVIVPVEAVDSVASTSYLASTLELKDSVLAATETLPNMEMINNKVKSLITLPEINENTDQEIQVTKTLAEINSEVKLKTDEDFRDEVEIFDSSSETKTAVKEEKKMDMELASQAVEVSLSRKDSNNIPLDGLSLQQYISSEEKSRFTYYFGYIVLGMAIIGSGMLFLRRYLK